MLPLTRSRNRARFFGIPFSPLSLFAGGIQGTWYDPSDLTTLFQDSAGTTPVTGVEQVVGRMLDKSGNGNTATSTGAARPTLRARYNLLEYSEQFDNAYWTKGAATISANTSATTDPLGGNTADKLIENNGNSAHFVERLMGSLSGVHTASIYAKAAERTWMQVNLYPFVNGRAWFDLANGVLGTVDAGVTASIENVGNGWYRCTASRNTNNTTYVNWYTATGNNGGGYLGDGTSGIYIWGAQLLNAADAFATGNAYQRVAAATVYDTSNSVWRPYLSFGGTQEMSTAAGIGISGNPAFSWWVGQNLLTTSDNGTFGIGDSSIALQAMGPSRFSNVGVVSYAGANSFVFASYPVTDNAVYSYNKTAGAINTTSSLRRNGVDNAGVGSSSNTPNIATNALVIGRWANFGGNYFNGRIYSLIIRGAASTAAEISATESWVNGKTGAY